MRDDLYTSMEAIEHKHWWFVAKRQVIRAMIDRYAPAPANGNRRVLVDIGCGTGGLLDETKSAFDVIGLDSAEPARAACERRGHTVRDCWLPDDLPVEAASADVCVMSDVLEHVEDDTGSVIAAASKLKPGGVLICTVPAHMWLWTSRDVAHEHKRRYARDEYQKLFEIPQLERVLLSWYMSVLLPLMLAERVARKLMGDPKVDDLSVPAAPVNATLRTAFASERHALGRLPIPIGASLISVYRRTGAPAN